MIDQIEKKFQMHSYYFNFYWGFYFFSSGFFGFSKIGYSSVFIRIPFDNLKKYIVE